MDKLETKTFPYSNIEIFIVKKEDILKTIDENIIDKDVANELISHLEVRAEKTLKNHGWAGFPYLGSIRIPPGLSSETRLRHKEAKDWALENLSKSEYIMFSRQCAYESYQMNKFKAYFDTLLSRAVNKDRKTYSILCSQKGKNYAACKMVFSNNLKPVKTNYEYYYELTNGTEQD